MLRELTVKVDVKQLEDALKKLKEFKNIKLDGPVNELKKTGRASKDVARDIKGASQQVDSFKKSLMKVGLVAGGLALAFKAVKFGIKLLNDHAENASNIMAGMTRAGGLSLEMFQTMGRAAEQNSSSIGAVQTAMVRLNKEAAETGDTRSADERLMDFADSLNRIKDPGQRAAYAVKRLGKSGAELVPILKDGRAGVKAMRKEFGDAILDTEKFERALKFKDAQYRIDNFTASIRNNLADAFVQASGDGKALHDVMDALAQMDFAPLINALAKVVNLVFKATSGIAKLLQRLEDNEAMEKRQVQSATEKILSGKLSVEEASSKGAHWSEKEAVARLYGTEETQKEILSRGRFGTETSLQNEDVSRYLQSTLRKDVKAYQTSFHKVIEDFEAQVSRGEKFTDKQMEKLEQILMPEAQVPFLHKRVLALINLIESGKGSDKKPLKAPPAGSSGGGSVQRTANLGDPLLKTVLHFKNEFIVFARRMLAVQNRFVPATAGAGYINSGISLGSPTYNVTVEVTGGGTAAETGRVVGQEVLSVFRTLHRETIQAMEKHRKDVTTELKRITAGEISFAEGPSAAPKMTEIG